MATKYEGTISPDGDMSVRYSGGYDTTGLYPTPIEEEAQQEKASAPVTVSGQGTGKAENFRGTPNTTKAITDRLSKLNNANWLSQTFAKTRGYSATLATADRGYDSSEYKFYDTTPGGYRAINPAPQFTRYADIKRRNRNSTSKGIGRYFSEAIDDAAQIIHIRAGVPESNSLTGFLARAYEPAAGKLARTGEGSSFFGAITELVGNVLMLPFVPFIQAWQMLKSVLSDAPNNKFYYSKAAMPLYYNACNTMLIKLAVDMKLIGGGVASSESPKKVDPGASVSEKETYNAAFKVDSELSEDDRRALNRMFPDIFDEEFGFDIRAMSTRYQRLANKDQDKQDEIAAKASSLLDYRRKMLDYYETNVTEGEGPTRIGPYLESYLNSSMATGGDEKKSSNVSSAVDSLGIEDDAALEDKLKEAYASSNDSVSEYGSFFSGTLEFLKAEFNEGSQWVSIRVEHTGTSSSSFGNSTEESGLASSINSASAKAQSMKMNFAGGNVGESWPAQILQEGFGAVTEIIGKAGAAVGAGAIGAMLGGGKLDIPKYWTDSTASLPGGSYSVKLRTPYGNKVSIFKDLYIPQVMLMCLALPKAAGPSAYTSPFLLEIYDPGRWQSSLAIMENLSIERGTGNLGWSKEGYPLGVDINFEIVDLTTIMAMPVTGQSFSFNDRSAYTDYMASLAKKSPLDQLTVGGRWRSTKKAHVAQLYSTFSAANLASVMSDTWAGRLIRAGSRSTSSLM